MKYEIRPPLCIYEMGKRKNQEDSIYPIQGQATADDRLFILCDGMGGHLSGEVASLTACEELSSFIKARHQEGVPFTDEDLRAAMNHMYDALDAKDVGTSEKKMGTTLVLLYFHAGGLLAAHLGDSRYYHIRPQTNEIIYRSRDHSVANIRFEAGEITFEELQSARNKNVILRAVLPHQDEREMPEVVHIRDIKPGDYFYMCSDGMLEQMTDEELLNVLCSKDLSDEQKQDWLLSSTDDNNDNHSAYLIHIAQVMLEAGDDSQPDDEAQAVRRNKAFLAEWGRDYQVVVAEEKEEVKGKKEDVRGKKEEVRKASSNGSDKRKFWGAMLLILAIVAFLLWLVFMPSTKNDTKTPAAPPAKTEQGQSTIQPPSFNKQEQQYDAIPQKDKTPTSSPSRVEGSKGEKQGSAASGKSGGVAPSSSKQDGLQKMEKKNNAAPSQVDAINDRIDSKENKMGTQKNKE